MIVKFSTLAGGVWITEALEDQGLEQTGDELCFKFKKNGDAKYALLSQLLKNPDKATWQSMNLKKKDFLFK